MSEFITLDPKSASAEFDRWGELLDFDFDPQYMNAETLEDFQNKRRMITKEIQSGRIVIGSDGDLTYTLKAPVKGVTALTFPADPDGNALLAMDQSKEGRFFAKLFAFTQSLTGAPPGTAAALKRRDRGTVLAIANLFL
jgi:hypothetical protein